MKQTINDPNKLRQSPLTPNILMAQRFLNIIAQSDDATFAFQTFADKKSSKTISYAQIFCGTFEEYHLTLERLNREGIGVFVAINKTDGLGRKTENITGVRAVFVDLDGSPLQPVLDAPIIPHIIVESSTGRYHAYWIIEELALENFTSIQKYLSTLFHGDPQVCDLPRVMRLPGFHHQKKDPFLTKIIHERENVPIAAEKFCTAFGISLEEQVISSNIDSSHGDNPILQALANHKMLIEKHSSPTGCWTIKCPWETLHSQQDKGTKYFEPNTNNYPGHGFKCFHKHCEARTVQDLIAFLGIDLDTSATPLPLQRSIEQPEPYPFDALGPILAPAAKALQRVIKAPDAICGQSVLAAAALAAQPHANVSIDGREIPLSLFFITVAESGDRKSATDKIALKAVYDWQKMLMDCYREELRKYQIQKELWEIRKKDWMRENTGSGEVFTELPPQPPLRPLLLVEEPTYEGIVKYFAADGQPSIGLFSDEGGRFFGGHAMNQDNRLKTIAGISSLWDGKAITRMRFGDGDMLLYGRRLSMHLMIQEVILSQIMSNNLYDLQGFLPRCLIAFPISTAGNRTYVEEDISCDPDIFRLNEALRKLLDRSLPVDPLPAPQNELKPRPLSLTREAKQAWIAYHDINDAKIADGQDLHPIRRFASKAPEHALRLSGVLAIVENPDVVEINLDCISRGIQLMDFYLKERLRIQGFATLNPDLVCASSLLKWLWNQGHSTIGLSTIYQYGPLTLGIRNADRARKMMGILTSHGWATPNPNAVIEDKKHKEAWSIKPPQE